MALRQIEAPASEPVSLAEAKAHLRVDGADEDDLLSSLIAAAREHAETFTGRQLVTATWRLSLDAFPACSSVDLPAPRLQSVASVKYYDEAGSQQTLDPAAYHVDTESEPGRLVLASGASWPSTECRPNAVQIEFVAGYGDADQVPAGIKAAIKLWVGDGYAFRETMVVGTVTAEMKRTVDDLLWPYKVFR